MDISRIAPIFVAILALVAAGYLMFGKDEGGTGVSETDGSVSVAEQTFLNLTAQIEPVELDTSILSDPRFMGLVDIGVAVIPEDAGRTDPFAPLPGIPARR